MLDILTAGFEKNSLIYKEFHSDMVSVLAILKDPTIDKTTVAIQSSKMERIIYNRFGIAVNFNISNITAISLVVPTNSIYSENGNDENTTKDLKYTVDYARLHIDNFKPDNIPNIYLDTEHMSQLTPKQLVAVILHEVGHAFYFYATLQRVVKNNSMLLDGLTNFTKGSKDDKSVVKEIVTSYDGTLSNKGLNSQAFEIVTKDIRNIMSLGGFGNHSSDFEELADAFVTKLGYGKDLADALDKITDYKPLIISISIVNFIIILLFRVTMTLLALAIPIGEFYAGFLIVSMVLIIVTDNGVTSYENFYERLESIKYNSIRMIRVNKLTKTEKKNIIKDIKDIDVKLKKYKNISKPILASLVGMFAASDADKLFNPEYIRNKLLQSLQDNELYLHSEEILQKI